MLRQGEQRFRIVKCPDFSTVYLTKFCKIPCLFAENCMPHHRSQRSCIVSLSNSIKGKFGFSGIVFGKITLWNIKEIPEQFNLKETHSFAAQPAQPAVIHCASIEVSRTVSNLLISSSSNAKQMWCVALLHGCFSRFSNCTNGTKSCNAPHIWLGDRAFTNKSHEGRMLQKFLNYMCNMTFSFLLKLLVSAASKVDFDLLKALTVPKLILTFDDDNKLVSKLKPILLAFL